MLQPVSITVASGAQCRFRPSHSWCRRAWSGNPGYCTTALTYSDPIAGPYRPTCYLDGDGDNRFETLWVAPGAIGFTYVLDPPVQYKSGQITGDASGYKYELLYQGLDGNTLRVGYREYIDNMARPAFAQELTYPTSLDATAIRFKSVRVEVLSADASEITSRILRIIDRASNQWHAFLRCSVLTRATQPVCEGRRVR